MSEQSNVYRVGDATVTRVLEKQMMFDARSLLPDWAPERVRSDLARLVPEAVTADLSQLILSVHTWVVRTRRRIILVDTGIGNHKTRALPAFNDLDLPYLARLRAAGVTPEQVDYVLLTHIHTDHVGWNTRLARGRWVPTFPNATYIFPQAGHDYFASPQGRGASNYDMYLDSIVPVIESGRVQMVGAEGGTVIEGFAYYPTAGHSVDHMSIGLVSDGAAALFGGDVMHHPIQVRVPEWNSVFCAAANAARASRAWAIDHALRHDALYFSSHFAGTSAGTITTGEGGLRWDFL